jgi:hypothetical protein
MTLEKGGSMSGEEKTEPQNRSPAEDDALKDADIKSGTGDPDEVYPEQEGEAGPASGFTPEAGGG